MAVKEGQKAPAFSLPAGGGGTVALRDFKGRALVLYFYPKDLTPGCTQEACDFRDAMAAFARAKVAVVGVSRDSAERHEKFGGKYGLNFPLAADEDGAVCKAYGVWVRKTLYGRNYMGIERATFLIDGKGVVSRVWRKVKVAGHAEDVLTAAKEL